MWCGYLFSIAILPTLVVTYNYVSVFLHFKTMLDGGAKADTIKGTAKVSWMETADPLHEASTHSIRSRY